MSELIFKVFVSYKGSQTISVYESQLKPELLPFLISQLKSAGFDIDESSTITLTKRSNCYILDYQTDFIVFYEYKLLN